MWGNCRQVNGCEENTESDHVPGAILDREGSDQGLPEEVEDGTNGYQTRHQADVGDRSKDRSANAHTSHSFLGHLWEIMS